MVEFVTKQQAREQIRLDDGADEGWLDTFIPAVSQQVANWLKDSWRVYQLQRDASGALILDANGVPMPVLDDDSNPVLDPSVVAATLIELANQYRFREGEGDTYVPSDAGWGYTLCRASVAILTPLRKPTVA